MANFLPPRDTRPSLPPLHSLGLPYPLVRAEQSAYDSYDSNDRLSPETTQPYSARTWARGRQSSVSSTTSSCTAPSRAGSPSDTRALAPSPEGFTLLLTTMDKANALIVVPQIPPVPQLPSPPPTPTSSSAARSSRTVRPLLITGPMVEHFKQNHTRISQVARMHPYRMVPKVSGRRRPSAPHSSLTTGRP
ncbi:uncharacterized protein C8Q71DRAFT_191647 [Rhodofomes roseus]|uniref:Uncharacterized protein n=1 Tax=Rhodofomes roseus TaxID=34475 RepID=A0ABQ8K7Y0_9APHY|nr:uncharacterized protein C8Q71DRAFT_191647 [Rhodofomes roseus]KAH9833149.1 hypothetical protein C8Q71DRAFT_191647 [Rhodofomes roseus]